PRFPSTPKAGRGSSRSTRKCPAGRKAHWAHRSSTTCRQMPLPTSSAWRNSQACRWTSFPPDPTACRPSCCDTPSPDLLSTPVRHHCTGDFSQCKLKLVLDRMIREGKRRAKKKPVGETGKELEVRGVELKQR